MEKLKAFCQSIPEEFRYAKDTEKVSSETVPKGDSMNSAPAADGAPAAAPAVADPLDSYEGPPITALDIRVGRINKVWTHEEADKLYCEEIDVGEDAPRQIASGLRPYLSEEDLDGRMVLVLCNLKARKLAGFPSHGMVLCSSNEEHTEVNIIAAPIDAKIGERVTVPGWDFEGEEGQPFKENKLGKKKVFEKLMPNLKTDEYGTPGFLGVPFLTSGGVCSSSLPG